MMLKSRFEGHTVEKITDNYDSTLLKIWSAYIKASREIFREFNLNEDDKKDWKTVIEIFKNISEVIDTANKIFFLKNKKRQFVLINSDYISR